MGASLNDRSVLVTGASGYVGGALVPPLLAAGASVRVLVRHADGISEVDWRDRVDVVEGDATEDADLDRALAGIDVAYYLLHSMDGGGSLEDRDRELAESFVAAAGRAGVRRIVYLGGMHPSGELSEHLASRAEVGEIFLDGEVPAVVLQAAVILGAGSTSFDMLRYLAGRLPVMVAPTWLRNRLQPIAIDDALHYLVGAAALDGEVNRSFDIGGPEVLSYEDLMQRFAAVTGRRRRLAALIPGLTPEIASLWVGTVTPVPSSVARPLMGSLKHEVVAQENDIRELLPKPGGLTSVDESLRQAESESPRDTGPRNLIATAAATLAAAATGAVATDPRSRWYRRLSKPSWQPPSAAFPLVWTALYADIVLSSAPAQTSLDREGRSAETRQFRVALLVNLLLNAGWSVAFFRAHSPRVAAAVSAALTASSADLARRAGTTKATRGLALAPYAGWSAFATALTAAIARRNR